MKAVIGPYPPPWRGTEVRAKEEFDSSPGSIFIGTSYLPGESATRILLPRRKFLFAAPILLWKIFRNKNRITEISAHFATTFGFLGFLSKKIFGIPYKVTCHGSDILLNLKKWPHRFFTLYALENAEKVVAVSNRIKNALEKENINREIDVIQSAVNRKIFSTSKEKKEKRIIFVGSVQKSKGIDILLDAFSRIKSEFPEHKILIVGRIEEKNYFKGLQSFMEKSNLRGRVIFAGEKRHEEIPELLRKSSLFVLPSRTEGYGIALAEAVACGLPCIASSAVPSAYEFPRKCKIVASASAEELAEAMRKVLKGMS